MKKNIFILILGIFLLNGCDNEGVTTDLVGEWELIEVLADPGDGSGRFRSVSSDKRVLFFEDGTYSSTGSLCDFSVASEGNFDGTYAFTDSGYLVSCGDSMNFSIDLRLEGRFLIVTFPCIEPCLQKFRKRN